jgi:3-mercaptopyruvate sulfurtransferase SseA
MNIPHTDLVDPRQAALFEGEQPPLPLAKERIRMPSGQAIPHEALASPTLGQLDATRRPKANTVCERCPNSVWFASPTEVKCYCRVMFLLTWSSREPQQLTNCDGMFLGQEK